jgi:hypothetical protein
MKLGADVRYDAKLGAYSPRNDEDEQMARHSISIDKDGNVEVSDDNGTVTPDTRPLPDIIGRDRIKKTGNIPYLRVQGSCYILVWTGTGWAKVPC